MSERYSRPPLIQFPVNRKTQFVYSPAGTLTRLLSPLDADILLSADRFKTLQEHIEDRCSKIPRWLTFLKPVARQVFVEVFSRLETDGLLIPLSGVLGQCRQWAAQKVSSDRISTLGLVNRDRLDLLERALTSYIRNVKQFGRAVQVVVVDDSSQDQRRHRCRQLLKTLSLTHQVPIFYAGLEEKRRFIKTLVSKGLPADVLQFALFGALGCHSTYGGNRNALLLHTIGELLLSADDDTVCQVAPTPGQQKGMALEPGDSSRQERWFYPDHESVNRSVSIEFRDLLGLHEQFLGKDVRQCLSDAADPESLALNRLDPWSLYRLLHNKNVVTMTFSGIMGDCPMTDPVSYLFLQGASRCRLLESPETYRLMYSRRVIIADRRNVLTNNPYSFLFATMGIDNRSLLPPFFPVSVGEDFLFMAINNRVGQNPWSARLPWLVRHDNGQRTPFSREIFGSVPTRLVDCMDALLNMMPPASSENPRPGVECSIQTLAQQLLACGNLSRREFLNLVTTGLWRRRSQAMAVAESLLYKHHGQPDFWAQDVNRYLHAVRKFLRSPGLVVPSDLAADDVEGAGGLFQTLVQQYGQLLFHWPSIRENAKQLRAQGYRFAQPV